MSACMYETAKERALETGGGEEEKWVIWPFVLNYHLFMIEMITPTILVLTALKNKYSIKYKMPKDKKSSGFFLLFMSLLNRTAYK